MTDAAVNYSEKFNHAWTADAPKYTEVIKVDLADTRIKENYKNLLREYLPKGEKLKILDCGCGPGYLSLLCAELGHEVVASDMSEGMLEQVKINCHEYLNQITTSKQDAMNLTFEDKTFDAIVTRNMTWLIQDVEKAYQSWYRVLKPNGCILNFDAMYMEIYNNPEVKAKAEQERNQLKAEGKSDLSEGDMEHEAVIEYTLTIPISKVKRPEWDVEYLAKIGFIRFHIEYNTNERLLTEEMKHSFGITPMFLLVAQK